MPQFLEEFSGHGTENGTLAKPYGLPKLRRQSWESRDMASNHREDYQRGQRSTQKRALEIGRELHSSP